jgi:hypothetical protein
MFNRAKSLVRAAAPHATLVSRVFRQKWERLCGPSAKIFPRAKLLSYSNNVCEVPGMI